MTGIRPSVEPQWLELARAGDMHAFSQLVRLHQSNVRRQLRRLTRGDLALADDLAQQTFVHAWRAIADFRGEARLSTWLHRIAYRCFLQDRRALGDEVARHDSLDADAVSDCDIAGDVQTTVAHADPARHTTLQIDVERALARLPEAERVAIVHCFHLDLSHDEAAEVLGLPLGTLKSHVTRGKARLRDWLAAWRLEDVA